MTQEGTDCSKHGELRNKESCWDRRSNPEQKGLSMLDKTRYKADTLPSLINLPLERFEMDIKKHRYSQRISKKEEQNN